MQCSFVKYQVAGNDFIVVNNFYDVCFVYSPIVTKQLCHRQWGIGADGIIAIEQKKDCDFAILHYNSDGSRGGGLCGNGARAAIHYAQQLGIIDEEAHFGAIDGLHTGYLRGELVYLKLQDVDQIVKLPTGYFLDNGTRHHVEIVDDIQTVNMQRLGFPRRRMEPFEKEGINLNFAQLAGEVILLRTCECGLETEPLSCGTGAVASALVMSVFYGLKSPIRVDMKGGTCWVRFKRLLNGQFTNIYLVGPVARPFHGICDLSALPAIVLNVEKNEELNKMSSNF